jgi:hypothetical protein
MWRMCMSEAVLPEVGSKAVHRDDHAKSKGPVWEVTGVNKEAEKPIRIGHLRGHKLNQGLERETKSLTGEEFKTDYIAL